MFPIGKNHFNSVSRACGNGEFFFHRLTHAFHVVAIYFSGLFHRIVKGRVVLVHTPKCGGTYLSDQYGLKYWKNIRSVGHARREQSSKRSAERVVGLIRLPSDWYASYYWFCKKSLANSSQSNTNFPEHHPISLFSDNSSASFERMMINMQDKALLANLCDRGVPAIIYGREIMDVFAFLERTNTGFWTWTIMYHFANISTECIRTKEDAVDQAKKIALSTDFIRQENLDSDVQRLLGIPQRKGKLINRSARPDGWKMKHETEKMINVLDGQVARILYGQHELSPSPCPIRRGRMHISAPIPSACNDV